MMCACLCVCASLCLCACVVVVCGGAGIGHTDTHTHTGTAIIAGTNLPSMFTPNGQAALLFILTSSIAPLIHLSYRKMMVRCPVCVCFGVCWCSCIDTVALTNNA